MFINNFDPVAFSLFSLEVRWYSLAYVFGIVFGWIYCKKILIKDNKTAREFDDLISYIIIGIVLGGRIGYVLFYNFSYYSKNLIEVIYLWKGGMSFHGGVIGVLLAIFFYSKSIKKNFFIFADLVAAVAPIGIFLGRIANYINSELYGKVTELPWSVVFIKVDLLKRHPSQIYEALFEGLILFIILNYLIYKKKLLKVHGMISAIFLILYSSSRFFIEFFREPDVQIGYLFFNLTMGQILSIILLIFGFYIYLKKNNA